MDWLPCSAVFGRMVDSSRDGGSRLTNKSYRVREKGKNNCERENERCKIG